MVLYVQKKINQSESDCDHFEESGVLETQAKVSSNTWFSYSQLLVI